MGETVPFRISFSNLPTKAFTSPKKNSVAPKNSSAEKAEQKWS